MDNQIQARVSPYFRWVVQGLVGRRGKNRSEVVSRIVGEWIEQHEEDLARWGLSLARFNEEMAPGPQGIVAGLRSQADPGPAVEGESLGRRRVESEDRG